MHTHLLRSITRSYLQSNQQLDDADALELSKKFELLEFGVRTLREQSASPNPDNRFVKNGLRAAAPLVKWAEDVQRHNSRRTLPMTNTRDKSQPRPANVIGFWDGMQK